MHLSPVEQTILESHSIILASHAEIVRKAVQNYNNSVLDAYDEVGETIQSYNGAATAARTGIREIVADLRSRWERRDDA